jgi:hypothetical protein
MKTRSQTKKAIRGRPKSNPLSCETNSYHKKNAKSSLRKCAKKNLTCKKKIGVKGKRCQVKSKKGRPILNFKKVSGGGFFYKSKPPASNIDDGDSEEEPYPLEPTLDELNNGAYAVHETHQLGVKSSIPQVLTGYKKILEREEKGHY